LCAETHVTPALEAEDTAEDTDGDGNGEGEVLDQQGADVHDGMMLCIDDNAKAVLMSMPTPVKAECFKVLVLMC
jgi:hypothetical protein